MQTLHKPAGNSAVESRYLQSGQEKCEEEAMLNEHSANCDYRLDRTGLPRISVEQQLKQIRVACDPMSMEILYPIPVEVDLGVIKKTGHVPEGEEEKRLLSLISAAMSVVAAKAVYRASYIDSKGEDSIVIDGILFKSKVLRKHFDKIERVFPYVVTIGNGVEVLERTSGDALEKYYLDLIGNAAVVKAREQLKKQTRQSLWAGGAFLPWARAAQGLAA